MTNQTKCIACDKLAPVLATNQALTLLDCPRCGRWEFSNLEGVVSQAPIPEPRYLLSAWLRDRWERTRQPYRFGDRPGSGVLEIHRDLSVPQKQEKSLLLMSRRSGQCGHFAEIALDDDYPMVWAHNAQELRQLLAYLEARRLVEEASVTRPNTYRAKLTAEGWTEVSRLQAPESHARQAFVAMWFDASLDSAFESGMVPALGSCGYDAYRVDRHQYVDKIDDHALAQIRRSGLMVADCTGLRPSVLFEAGFAMGLGVPVVWSCREDHLAAVGTQAFDVRQYPFVVWTCAEDLRSRLADKVAAAHPRSAT